MNSWKKNFPLYDPLFEQDGCGTGFIANLSGVPSHSILEQAVEAVVNLTHRGAISADAKTGDGAGILTQIPYPLFKREIEKSGRKFPKKEDFAVGMVFLPRQSPEDEDRCRAIIEEVVTRYGISVIGWRRVPIDSSCLGERALANRPEIEQILLARRNSLPQADFERTLYLARREIEKEVLANDIKEFYIPSFSSRTLVYKGLLSAPQLSKFYLDLTDPEFESSFALFHQRYSTNTFPNWFLAQPFRYLAHNGEINTIRGNYHRMRARESDLQSEIWGEKLEILKPIIQPEGSDSAMLDNVLELLTLSGRDILHSMMMLIPEAWQNAPNLSEDLVAFFKYHSCLIEPWDGPAAITFTDGRIVAATLDRNGLRPARYWITKDGLVFVSSEVGVLEIEDSRIVEKGRLAPGNMLAVDTLQHKILRNAEIKRIYSENKPYKNWIAKKMISLSQDAAPQNISSKSQDVTLTQKQVAFGYSSDEISLVITPMALEGKEPVGSMGDDTPLAILSKKPRNIYSYFKQLFAQVTNPPIDPIREYLVMSLATMLGAKRNILEETELHAEQIFIQTPILFENELEALKNINHPSYTSVTLSALFPVNEGAEGFEKALESLCQSAEKEIDQGKTILILSDRGVNKNFAPIPMLLAMAAVRHHLIRKGRRMRASILCETGDAREVHHFCLLLAYGASAVVPYLVYETIAEIIKENKKAKDRGITFESALKKYRQAVDNGILKVMSKMGISTLTSYRGAQIFEAIGLSRPLVERYFTGTPSRIGGVGLREIAEDVLKWHQAAFGKDQPKLDVGGNYLYRKDGEYHAFNPMVVRALHQAIEKNDYQIYLEFARLIEERPPTALRDLLQFKKRRSIPVEEVEPIEEIRKRFVTSSMSLGALSPEAHETLAIAMNAIGGKSGSGEGGEDPRRFKPYPDGRWANSAIKQVASARFGVTPEYLMSAQQLEIKMAQGSKPGEGGQIPGIKVTPHIASLRHAVPGISLISPPPHHDIYSIEDLAQLIYDLKQINPQAKIAVKLVSETGVGTIASGVAKAHADVILISGHDGGTGASPLSSIKNAGSPWEIGLAETQQVLRMNDLRGRVTLRCDGGMKTGLDVVMAAIFGAEEFGFGTAALVAAGCVMARQCHMNSCPVGVATQREDLRKKFPNSPERVIRYMNFVAQEVREILASLGFRKLEDIIGRTDLLEVKHIPFTSKAYTLDFSSILAYSDPAGKSPLRCVQARNDFPPHSTLDEQILSDASAVLEGRGSVKLSYKIYNRNRAVGALTAGEIARRYGNAGLPHGTIECTFRGVAGQSFGAFCIHGLRLILIGEANDYVGKGMSGGEIIVKPSPLASFNSWENVIVGNTVMYGATGGSLYVCGRAGERFCVRNSGGQAVVEGTGDHCCEYMTGGLVVVLGSVGRNFAAGMTGGTAFVFDEEESFAKQLNRELVLMDRISHPEDETTLKTIIARHYDFTKSKIAEKILSSWEKMLPCFWKVHPREIPAKTEELISAKE